MKKLLVSFVVFILSAVVSNAADMIDNSQSGTPDKANFTGIYVLGNYGFQDQRFSSSTYSTLDIFSGVSGAYDKLDGHDNAHMLGFTLGGGYQFRNNLYLGGEFEGMYAVHKAGVSDKPFVGFKGGVNMAHDLSAVFGYVYNVNNDFALMPYLKAGMSFGRYTANDAVGDFAESKGKTADLFGGKFGVGLAALYKRFIVKAEYAYYVYDNHDINASYVYESAMIDRIGVQSLNIGVGYKFL